MGENILLIEDEEKLARFVELELCYEGYGVTKAKGLLLDVNRRTVTVKGKPVELTKREFDLLYYLLKNKGIVISRETILEHVWNYDFDGGTNAVDVYVRFLRGKIDEVFDIKLIHTVRGVGYVIKDEQ